MKKYVLSFLMILCIILPAESPYAEQTTPPTLEETLKFIKLKTKHYGSYIEKTMSYGRSGAVITGYSSYEPTIEYEDCKIKESTKVATTVESTIGSPSYLSGINTIEFNLSDMDGNSLTKRKFSGKEYWGDGVSYTEYPQDVYLITYKTKNGAASVKKTLFVDGTIYMNKTYSMSFVDKDISERVSKAFTYAIELCDKEKTKEPF